MQPGERTPRGPATFRQRDVKAALRAARAAGENVVGFEIRPDGRIRVIVGQEGIAAEKKNPWDDED